MNYIMINDILTCLLTSIFNINKNDFLGTFEFTVMRTHGNNS